MKWVALLVLLGINFLIFSVPVRTGLTVSFLNVGQGDAILIEGPTGVQVLVDGGPGAAVLRELGAQLPFFDRSIDAIVATHPDADHVTGLIDVLGRYEVGTILENGDSSDTRAWASFATARDQEVASGAADIIAKRGMRILLNSTGTAYADVLYPDRDVAEIKESNDGSIILHVVYGATSFMLTGDAPADIEDHLITIYGSNLASDVLKAGHHGSQYSSTPEFLAAVAPQYGVFSRGCENRYGHPAPRVSELFASLHIPIFDTCLDGTVTFHSDGQTLSVSRELLHDNQK